MIAETTRRDWTWRLLDFAAMGVVVAMIAWVCSPIFADTSTLGGHDWDENQAQRYLVVKSLKQFHQFPFWNPYACGGHDAWGNVQGGTNIVSPWLPLYLLFDLRWAVRLEVVGAALLSAAGTWLWAGRFTKSAAARAFVCVLFVVNGRWALQTATGHAWHLYYAWMPWTFYCFDRACDVVGETARTRKVALLGASVCFALMVYTGAIYPLPHTGLLVVLYAAILSVFGRTVRPLANAMIAAVIGGGLAAPKLLPSLVSMDRYPRLVESRESIDLNAFVQLLVARGQVPSSAPARTPQWGWHEYGMYIGWIPILVVAVAIVATRRHRERALLYAGVCATALGFGAFHERSPWTLLHELPVFKSQHVPSRWLYPAVLLLATLVAATAERVLARRRLPRMPLEVLSLLAVSLIAYDIAREARRPMARAFWMKPPAPRVEAFQQNARVPASLRYAVSDYAPPALPAEIAGVGVIDCTMHGGLNVWAPKGPNGRPIGLGARGRDEPGYRGEAFLASGNGKASIVRFSPNEVEVEVSGATPGDTVVLNQNWDPGWTADGVPTEPHDDAVSARVKQPNERILFRFRSRRVFAGIGVMLATVGTIIAAWALGRRPKRATVPAQSAEASVAAERLISPRSTP